jgi:hypothetical protein
MIGIPAASRIVGTVALARAQARLTYPSLQVSDHEGQFGERVGETSRRPDIGPKVVETPAEVLDEGVSGDDHPRGSVTLQPSHRSKAGLETPVIGLERIVRVGFCVVEGRREQLTQDARVDPVPVGGDLGGRYPSAADPLGEEPTCGLSVPPRREEDVDDLAELVDGPEQVAPGPPDFQVRLIDMPAIADQMLSSSCGLGELRREPLDPPVDRDVVDLDPALAQELLDVPIRQAEPQIPADCQVMTSGGKRYPAKAELAAGRG